MSIPRLVACVEVDPLTGILPKNHQCRPTTVPAGKIDVPQVVPALGNNDIARRKFRNGVGQGLNGQAEMIRNVLTIHGNAQRTLADAGCAGMQASR